MEAAPAAVERKPRRLLRRTFWSLLWLATALLLVWLTAFAVAGWEYKQATAALESRDEPTTFSEAVSRNLMNAESPNAAEHLLEALREDQSIGQPGNDLAQFPNYYAGEFLAADLPKAKQLIDGADRLVSLLEYAVELSPGPLTSPLWPDDDVSTRLMFNEFQDMRSVGRLLSGDVKYAAQTGDVKRAVKRIVLGYRLTELIAAERFLLPQYIRVAMIGSADSTLRQVIPTLDLSPEQTVELDELLVRIEANLIFLPAMINERALTATAVENSAALFEQLQGHAQRNFSNANAQSNRGMWLRVETEWAKVVASVVGLPVRKRAAARILRTPTEVLKLVDLPPPWPEGMKKQFDEWDQAMNVTRLGLSPQKSGPLYHAASANLRAHRRLALLRFAVRLKHFHQKHGKLPTALEDLCGPGMTTLPTKWFEGKPFKYESRGNAFTITAELSDLDSPFAAGLATREDWQFSHGLLLKMDFSPPKKAAP